LTKCVVEVGPVSVRGPRDVEQDLVSTALGCIDDEIALLDEHPVAVSGIWRAVFRSVLSDCSGTAVLVCPTWWSSTRLERVEEAASGLAAEVVVLRRAEVLTEDEPGVPTLVEIAPEFVVIWRSGRVVMAEPRRGEPMDVAKAVAGGVGGACAVLVDAPIDVEGGSSLATAISARLRSDGLAVATVRQDRVLAGVRDQPRPWAREPDPPARRGPRPEVLAAGIVAAGLSCVGLASGFGVHDAHPTAVPMTLLIEGRVAVKVPARWMVQRITAGPGSARVEVTAPDDASAVLVTQSQVRQGERLADTAGMLRNALDDQQDGIFSRFNPNDRRADRPAATYREVREGRQIDWTVFVDDTVRIAVGCRSNPGGEQAVQDICDEAIRSAHAVV
jgi:type VII secretion-associated protein (TIGR03931 family)